MVGKNAGGSYIQKVKLATTNRQVSQSTVVFAGILLPGMSNAGHKIPPRLGLVGCLLPPRKSKLDRCVYPNVHKPPKSARSKMSTACLDSGDGNRHRNAPARR